MDRVTSGPGTALLLIDLQVGVVRDAFDVDGVLSRTQALVERARAVGAAVIFVSHEEEEMPRNSIDWQLAPPLHPLPGDSWIFKEYRDAFVGTGLADTLDDLGVSRLLVVGAQSDYCVRTTAQRAAAEGYDVALVGDCHTTTDTEFQGVMISARQIIAHTNRFFAGLRYPGQHVSLEDSDAVLLS